MLGGSAAAACLAVCCAGGLAVFGLTSATIALGAWRFDLLDGRVIAVGLVASLVVAYAGHRALAKRTETTAAP